MIEKTWLLTFQSLHTRFPVVPFPLTSKVFEMTSTPAGTKEQEPARELIAKWAKVVPDFEAAVHTLGRGAQTVRINGRPFSPEDLQKCEEECRKMGLLDKDGKVRADRFAEAFVTAFVLETIARKTREKYPQMDDQQVRRAIGEASAMAAIETNPVGFMLRESLQTLHQLRSDTMNPSYHMVDSTPRDFSRSVDFGFSLEKGKLMGSVTVLRANKFVDEDRKDIGRERWYRCTLQRTFGTKESSWQGTLEILEALPSPPPPARPPPLPSQNKVATKRSAL